MAVQPLKPLKNQTLQPGATEPACKARAQILFLQKNALIKKTIDELHRISPEVYREQADQHVVVVLDNIRSRQNTGSIFRTCDAFRIGRIHLCAITGIPPDREIERTALGATQSVNWQYWPETLECIEALRKEGYRIVSIEQTHNSCPLQDFNLNAGDRVAFVFGNEVHGVAEAVVAISDLCIEIPQHGTKHSLNVAITAGIVLWELTGRSR